MPVVFPWLALLTFALPPALEQWRSEIEAAGQTPVHIGETRVSADGAEISLPDATPARPLFVHYLRQPDFLRQFLLMRAVLVHHQSPEASAFLVLLNGARRAEWEPFEHALIAHEFGHAWLRARRFPTPAFQPGPLACLSIHTADIVQHVLIRKELDERALPHLPLALASMQSALDAAAPLPGGEGMRRIRLGDPCLALRQSAEWTDARMSFPESPPEVFQHYEAAMLRLYPDLEPTVSAITATLRNHDLEDHDQHRRALVEVHALLLDLLNRLALPPRP